MLLTFTVNSLLIPNKSAILLAEYSIFKVKLYYNISIAFCYYQLVWHWLLYAFEAMHDPKEKIQGGVAKPKKM